MIPPGKGRLAIVGGLFLLLVGLLVWHGALEPAPHAGVYPGNDELAENFHRYHGDLVTASGRVQSLNPVVIESAIGPKETLRLTIEDLHIEVREGDELRVFGVAREGRTIESRTAFAVPSYGFWYAYSTSLLGGIWVLARLVEHWQFDTRNWTLKRRPQRVGIPTRIRHWIEQLPVGGD